MLFTFKLGNTYECTINEVAIKISLLGSFPIRIYLKMIFPIVSRTLPGQKNAGLEFYHTVAFWFEKTIDYLKDIAENIDIVVTLDKKVINQIHAIHELV